MRNLRIYITVLLALLAGGGVCTSQGRVEKIPDSIVDGIRSSAVKGAFYPADADTLKRWVNEFLRAARTVPAADDVRALVAPHAGYVYSGWVAGEAYRQVIGRRYDAVVIVAPSHYRYFQGASVFNGQGYRTPLGIVKVDRRLADAIARVHSKVLLSDVGHRWDSASPEHALEVQLPFLQVALPETPIVPIVMGSQDFPTVDALMRAIVAGVRTSNKRVLLVASSDLSHYHRADTARRLDSSLISALARFDYHLMGMRLFNRQWEACGGGPMVAVMMAAEQLGAVGAKPLRYMNSADAAAGAARPDRVVGYMAAVMTATPSIATLLPDLTDQEAAALVNMARETVRASVLRSPLQPEIPVMGTLNSEYPAFVTIIKGGRLRGCIGYVIPEGSVLNTVRTAAPLAALHDKRFQPVAPAELPELEYEVTVLSRFRRVLDTIEVVPGRDGIYLRVGNSTGIFLPQVAVDQHWDKRTFLEQIGLKAGLDSSAYLRPDAELYRFEACVVK